MRARIAELRNAAQRILKLSAKDDHLDDVVREHGFVVGELAFEFARSEQAPAELEEEMNTQLEIRGGDRQALALRFE